MSLLRAAPSRILPLTRTRVFSTSPFVSRSVVEGTKDALKAADRAVSDAAVKGIEKGGTSPIPYFASPSSLQVCLHHPRLVLGNVPNC